MGALDGVPGIVSVEYVPDSDHFIVHTDEPVNRQDVVAAIERRVIAKPLREWLALRGGRWAPASPSENEDG